MPPGVSTMIKSETRSMMSRRSLSFAPSLYVTLPSDFSTIVFYISMAQAKLNSDACFTKIAQKNARWPQSVENAFRWLEYHINRRLPRDSCKTHRAQLPWLGRIQDFPSLKVSTPSHKKENEIGNLTFHNFWYFLRDFACAGWLRMLRFAQRASQSVCSLSDEREFGTNWLQSCQCTPELRSWVHRVGHGWNVLGVYCHGEV